MPKEIFFQISIVTKINRHLLSVQAGNNQKSDQLMIAFQVAIDQFRDIAGKKYKNEAQDVHKKIEIHKKRIK